jgi:hypothetical protein
MMAQVSHGCVRQCARRFGQKHLAAVAGCCDTRAAMQIDANVPAISCRRLARVETYSDPDATRRERQLSLPCGRHRIRGAGERHEEGITLGVDLDAVVSRKGIAQDSPVLLQRFAVSSSKLAEQRG